jgi:hypothetical protein
VTFGTQALPGLVANDFGVIALDPYANEFEFIVEPELPSAGLGLEFDFVEFLLAAFKGNFFPAQEFGA